MPPRGWRKPLLLTLASGGLLWAAFPPLGIAPLAWVALVPVLLLVHDKHQPTRRFRWYLLIWFASSLHWLAMTQGIRLAHWSTHFAWIALGLYLGLYLPLFIGLTRVAIHRCRWPLMIAAPLTWTGLELVRGYALSGFSMGLLAHTQVRWIALIQLSDLFGAYGVSFLVMLVNAAIADGWATSSTRRAWSLRLATALLAVGLAVTYGALRQTGPVRDEETRSLKIALLQGSIDTTFNNDPAEFQRMHSTYRQLSIQARQDHPDLDLIVWPESMFPFGPEIIHDREPVLPDALQIDRVTYLERIELQKRNFQSAMNDLVRLVNENWTDAKKEQLDIHMILGTGVQEVDQPSTPYHNAALWVRPDSSVADRYYKSHLVVFGEYVPLANRFPWLYKIVPFSRGITPGTDPTCFTIHGVKILPSICFESIVPHFMRRQVNRLADQGFDPEILINITNDGWFWGSSILDLQLSCNVFRAVELRMPLLVAANTGFSAVIDSQGTIRQQGPRREQALLVESVQAGSRFSFYRKTGDLLGIGAALFCLLLGGIGLRNPAGKSRQKYE